MNLAAATVGLLRALLLGACACGAWPGGLVEDVCRGTAATHMHAAGVYAHAAAVAIVYLGGEGLPTLLMLHALRELFELPRSESASGAGTRAAGTSGPPLPHASGHDSSVKGRMYDPSGPGHEIVHRDPSVHGGELESGDREAPAAAPGSFFSRLRHLSTSASPRGSAPNSCRGPTGYVSFRDVDVAEAPPERTSPFRWSFSPFAAAAAMHDESCGTCTRYSPEPGFRPASYSIDDYGESVAAAVAVAEGSGDHGALSEALLCTWGVRPGGEASPGAVPVHRDVNRGDNELDVETPRALFLAGPESGDLEGLHAPLIGDG